MLVDYKLLYKKVYGAYIKQTTEYQIWEVYAPDMKTEKMITETRKVEEDIHGVPLEIMAPTQVTMEEDMMVVVAEDGEVVVAVVEDVEAAEVGAAEILVDMPF